MKTIIIIPTFCERDNMDQLFQRIQNLHIKNLDALVVDDHSPDGTSHKVLEWVEKTRHKEAKVMLLERIGLRGRGTAGITGIAHALNLGADLIVEMDADLSHPPEVIPRMIELSSRYDIVVGSRLHEKSIDHRSWHRRLITRFANRYTRLWLETSRQHTQVRDWTSGFRLYRREVFERIPPASLVSTGPSILQEILFRALNQELYATEIDFEMKDRAHGKSTFTKKVAFESLRRIPCYRLLFSQEVRGSIPFLLSEQSTTSTSENYWKVSNRVTLKSKAS